MDKNGLIVKGVAGFYYVESENCIYTCKARGAFRKNKTAPLIGDRVVFNMDSGEEGVITEILPRKNSLIRPPVANIDKLFIVVSVQDPAPNILIIDKTIAAAEVKNIEPVLVITKTDFGQYEYLKEIYESVGIKVVFISSVTGEGVDSLRPLLSGVVSVFTGNSGVGKSTLINGLFPDLVLATGEISKKLGRGRHTTRHVELYKFDDGCYVADTPGFSTMDIEQYEMIEKDNIIYGFREFEPYMLDCKFTSCSHTCEKGCAVIKAVNDGLINKSRFESYVAMYNEVKDIKQWKIQKNV